MAAEGDPAASPSADADTWEELDAFAALRRRHRRTRTALLLRLHRFHDTGVQTCQNLPQRPHGVQTQLAALVPGLLHLRLAGTAHQTRHARAARLLQAGAGEARQRIDNAVEEIHRTQIAVVVQKDLRQRARIGADLVERVDDDALVFGRRILGIQNDKKDVRHKGFNFAL